MTAAATAERPTTKKPARDSFNKTAAERQMKKNARPVREARMYRVTKTTRDGPVTRDVKAHDESEAWAVFCDLLRSWPSRHAVDAVVEPID